MIGKDDNSLIFYRIILIIAAFLYIIFAIFFSSQPGFSDPMPFSHRLAGILIFSSAFILSFLSNWIKNNLRFISYGISILSLIHLSYILYSENYPFVLAVGLIISAAIINLLFRGDRLAFYSNVGLIVSVAISLLMSEVTQVFTGIYFLIFVTLTGLTYYNSHNKFVMDRRLKDNMQKQEMLLNTIDTQIWYLIDENTYGRVNQAHADFLGVDKEEIEHKKMDNCLSAAEAGICKKGNVRVFSQKEKITTEEWLTDYRNEKRLLSITKNPKLNSSGEVEYVVCSAEDITENKKVLEKLRFQYRFEQIVADISADFVGMKIDEIDQTVNSALKKIGEFFEIDRSYIFEFSEDGQFISNTYEWCAEGIEPQQELLQQLSVDRVSWGMKKLKSSDFIYVPDVSKLPEEAEEIREMLAAQNIKTLLIIPLSTGEEIFGFFGFDAVKEKREFNQKQTVLLKLLTKIMSNAFEKYRRDKKIHYLTFHDSLTGLYNRTFFKEEMKRLDTKRQLPLSIIMADVNGLKIINDSFGHEKGDELIVKAAQMLKDVVREEDILARQGGDEFAILLPETGSREVKKIVNRIKKKSEKTEQDQIPVSLGLGAATKAESDPDMEELLKEADDAMYQNKLSESRSTKSKIVQSLLNTLSAKSNETKEHALRMSYLASRLGEKIGLSNTEVNRLSLLANLHDIGKTTISEKILTKPGSLTEEEWETIKKHPERGYKIASASEEFAAIADDIYSHHERWDGRGYPRQLEEDEIPYLARLIAIIDAYDVMTHDRVYSKAISKQEALTEIKECAGTHFDPYLVQKFISMIQEDKDLEIPQMTFKK